MARVVVTATESPLFSDYDHHTSYNEDREDWQPLTTRRRTIYAKYKNKNTIYEPSTLARDDQPIQANGSLETCDACGFTEQNNFLRTALRLFICQTQVVETRRGGPTWLLGLLALSDGGAVQPRIAVVGQSETTIDASSFALECSVSAASRMFFVLC